MPHELPKAYDPALIEEKWARFWADEHLFDVPTPPREVPSRNRDPVILSEADAQSYRASAESKDPEDLSHAHTAGSFSTSANHPFVQLLPPPNVTGRLHMGHMLNQTEMDILTRWHRMLGDTSLWIPGTDHAGIATQMMVERQLAAEGKSRTDFTREAFTARVWAWKQQYGSAITEQMKRLGASVDWSREYFTMDARLSVAVKEAFVRLWNQGLIYRGAYIVNWDPQLQTAVSDLEVLHEERAGKLYYVRYPLQDGSGSVVVATTRPETILGDVAVAVNPGDERYKPLIGRILLPPLSAAGLQPSRALPILADDWADPAFGTGAVKVTPAHDPNDFAIGQRHNLARFLILDQQARIVLPGTPYHGLDRFEARERIVQDLRTHGALVDIKDHTHAIAISQRTGAVIEPRLSMQWFLAVNKEPQTPGGPFMAESHPAMGGEPQKPRNSIAANAIAAVRSSSNPDGPITFTPDMYTKTYTEWMSNLHDWCLSRQLWWGHRIPAWHCGACHEINVALEAPTACSRCSSTQLTQETDVLDTWFSSGLLPFTVFGWPGAASSIPQDKSVILSEAEARSSRDSAESKDPEGASPTETVDPFFTLTPDLAAFYPTSLLVTGFDILFFWVARMIMLGCHFMLDVPMPNGAGGERPRTLAEAVPFKTVYIHALVRDADRQKMSKTKGNVIDPIEIVTQYGTDAVRFTLASQASPGTDIAFNEARTEGYRAFANKIWNAARFLQMNLDRAREAGYKIALDPGTIPGAPFMAQSGVPGGRSLHAGVESHRDMGGVTIPLETRWIFSRLHTVCDEVARALTAYRFDEAANAVYQFFWGEFCDWYLELVKLRLNFDEPTNPTTALTLSALVTVFDAALRLLSPFMPFLTEELWHALYASLDQPTPAKSIALTRYPQPADFPADPDSVAAMNILQELIIAIRGLRKDLGVPEKEAAPITIYVDNRIEALIAENTDMLTRLARGNRIDFAHTPLTGSNSRTTSNFDVAVLYERQIDVPAERERLTRDLAKFNKGLDAADRQLSNDGFLARAPTHIVEGLRKQHAETLALKQKAEAALAALPEQ